MQEQRALGNILVRHGVMAPDALEPFYAQQREKPTPLFELLLTSKVATTADLARALAAECRVPFRDHIDVGSVPADMANKLPISYAKNHKLLVVGDYEDRVEVVCADPLDTDGLDDIRAAFQKPVTVFVAPSDTVINAINQVYERQQTISELETAEVADAEEIDILDSDDDAPIIRWVNGLFSQAVKERASDIHIEPEEREVLVRYRVDGQLYVARRASRQFMSSVIARVKIMAGLNIAEKRLPQDGRISLRIAGRSIDIRVSTIPTSRDHERIVMRLLHKTSKLLDIAEVGFSDRDRWLME